MTCCRAWQGVFRYQREFDHNAVERTLADAREKIQNQDTTILPSSSQPRPRSPAFFEKGTFIDENLPPCQFRQPYGVTKIGSKKIQIYDCQHFMVHVHKDHCLKCPLIKIPEADKTSGPK